MFASRLMKADYSLLIQHDMNKASVMYHQDPTSRSTVWNLGPWWQMSGSHWWQHRPAACVCGVTVVRAFGGVCVSTRVPVRGGSVRGERERPKASVCPGLSGSAEEPPCGGGTLFPAYTFSSSVYTPVIYEGWRHDQMVSTTLHLLWRSAAFFFFLGKSNFVCGVAVIMSRPSNEVRPESTYNMTSSRCTYMTEVGGLGEGGSISWLPLLRAPRFDIDMNS